MWELKNISKLTQGLSSFKHLIHQFLPIVLFQELDTSYHIDKHIHECHGDWTTKHTKRLILQILIDFINWKPLINLKYHEIWNLRNKMFSCLDIIHHVTKWPYFKLCTVQ